MRVQEAKISRLGVSGLMDVVLISEREGVRKPDAEIFHRALGRLGVSPSDAWFVGDNPEDDVAGAAAAGLRSFWRAMIGLDPQRRVKPFGPSMNCCRLCPKRP